MVNILFLVWSIGILSGKYADVSEFGLNSGNFIELTFKVCFFYFDYYEVLLFYATEVEEDFSY